MSLETIEKEGLLSTVELGRLLNVDRTTVDKWMTVGLRPRGGGARVILRGVGVGARKKVTWAAYEAWQAVIDGASFTPAPTQTALERQAAADMERLQKRLGTSKSHGGAHEWAPRREVRELTSAAPVMGAEARCCGEGAAGPCVLTAWAGSTLSGCGPRTGLYRRKIVTALYRNGSPIHIGDHVQGYCQTTNKVERGFVQLMPSGNNTRAQISFLALVPPVGPGAPILLTQTSGWCDPSGLDPIGADGNVVAAVPALATTP